MAHAQPDGLPAVLALQPPTADGNEAQAPFLVTFTSGFQPCVDGDVKWEIYRHKTYPRSHVIVARTQWVDFVGYTHGADRSRMEPSCMYAVGQISGGSKMSYQPVAEQHVIRLEPQMPGDGAAAATGAASPDLADKRARRAANKRLVEQFGSTRRKRQLTAQEMGAVNPDSIEAPEQVTALLEAAHVKAVAGGTTKAEVLAAAAAARNIPPHHPDATTADEAYRIREIIPPAAWHSLQPAALREAALAVARGETDAGPAADLPPYVRSRLRLLLAEGLDKSAVKRRSRALGWLAALLAMYPGGPQLKVKGGGGLAAIARQKKLPADVLEAVVELFWVRHAGGDGEAEAYSRPEPRKTLMLQYIFVTALLLEDWQMGPAQYEALRSQLGMRSEDVVRRLRELGATATPIKSTPGAGSASKDTKQYHVALLPPDGAALEPRTLADAFPKLKTGRKGGR